MIVDLGTGDGRAALAAAEAAPETLVIAMDADAASMADASRRAARSSDRGGLPNTLFVVAAAEAPPFELAGMADELRILFPWASLLRGVLGYDRGVATGIVRLLRPGGTVRALVSIARRDGLTGLESLDDTAVLGVADRLARHGLSLVDARPATVDEVRATRSTWGRRLLAGPDRSAWWLRLEATEPLDAAVEGRPEWAAV